MELSERVAYLRGLAEGMKLDTETNEGKLISVIIDILEDVALEIADINENALDIGEELDALIEQFDIRSGQGSVTLAGSLSGGNQQKVIVAREISLSPKVLLVAQPTRGLDVGAIEFIHKALVTQRDKGKAVLLVSFELDEIFNLSDRIAVINAGRLVDIVKTEDTDVHKVGLMMAGSKSEKEEAK